MNDAQVIDFGREICGDLAAAERREWLVTNGIGGYASGTVAGLPTRRYHGLLVAALQPPLGRTLLLSKLDETATYDGRDYPLFSNRWANAAVEPAGYHHIERFRLEGTTPTWSFACADALLEKRIWMQPAANTTYIRYDLRRASAPLTLSIKALVDYRDHHALTRAGEWRMDVQSIAHGVRVTAFEGAVPLHLLSPGASATPQHQWYRGYLLRQEDYRGLDALDDKLYVAKFTALLQPGESLTLVASTEPTPNLNGRAAYLERQGYEQGMLMGSGQIDAPPWIQQLVLAADQFIVRRAAAVDADGRSVIAGYPWFGDWGRDTMISLPGLTLATGRHEVAASILRTFADYVDRGMLPNRFPDAGDAPEYNTVDATLWYFEAIRAYFAATDDEGLLRDLYPVLQEIVVWYQRGTRYSIHGDPADGLLYAGEPGVQLTWMDAKVDDWVVTPRIGKPIEINALWYNALRSMADFARRLGQSAATYDAMAERTRVGFARFWNEEAGYCFDVLDGPAGDDPTLRPNQLLAVSLTRSPLDPAQQHGVVDACARHFLTSHGLRSLAPDPSTSRGEGGPAYIGHYGGDQRQRDGAYHQGTVWGWLIGPFVSAHLRVYRDPMATRAFLAPFAYHLADHGLGSVSEIFDGDAPFTPRGCIAQAWSVAEVLRAWHETGTLAVVSGT